VFSLFGALAQLERERTAERVSTVMAYKASIGEHCGGPARGMAIEGKRLVADEGSEGLQLLARARALRGEGLSYAKVAEQLNAEGFRPERGARIHASMVGYLLNNPRLAVAAA